MKTAGKGLGPGYKRDGTYSAWRAELWEFVRLLPIGIVGSTLALVGVVLVLALWGTIVYVL
jgi:hypothetical protein